MQIKNLVEKNKDYVIALRRHFHKYPEASLKEFETSKKIKEELEKMGIDYVGLAVTGVIADIKGGKPGKTIALRADMDALSVDEIVESDFKSQNKGLMHACGHDSHIAMLLGAAKVLNDIKDEISGTVRLLFQPAEETGEGAKLMIEDGALKGVDGIFGMHISSQIPTGKIAIEDGAIMASADIFSISVKGKGGHGSEPQNCIDALVVSSAIVMNLQSVVSREMKPHNPVVLTVGKLNSGTRFNVIAENGYMEGTTRCFDLEVRKNLPVIMERIIKNTAEAYRAEATLDYNFVLAPTINEPKCAALGRESIKKILGEEGIFKYGKIMGGEDFSKYVELIPGAFAFVGCGNEEKNSCYSHHSGNFAIDEDSLAIGTSLYIQYALDYLSANN